MSKTKKITFISIFAALCVVCAQLSIPVPTTGVSITLQTFSVALCGFALGSVCGTAATAVYILLGVVGLPVFTGFQSSSALVGPTAGFIFGFLPFAALCGRKNLLFGILGLVLCHAAGITNYAIYAHISPWAAFTAVSLPYIIKDLLSVLTAFFISKRIIKAVL